MKGIVKFTVTALVLAVFVVVFAGEALAATRPSWVGWSWNVKLVKNPNVKNVQMSSADYWALEIKVTHKNNSSNRDITAFYDKTLTFSATMSSNLTFVSQRGKAVKYTMKSTRVNNVNVWPGRSYTLTYWMPVKNLISPGGSYRNNLGQTNNASWRDLNENLQRMGTNAFGSRKLGYDVNVRSKAN